MTINKVLTEQTYKGTFTLVWPNHITQEDKMGAYSTREKTSNPLV